MVKERTEFGWVLTKNSPIAFCRCRFEFYVVFSTDSTWLVSLSTLCRPVLLMLLAAPQWPTLLHLHFKDFTYMEYMRLASLFCAFSCFKDNKRSTQSIDNDGGASYNILLKTGTSRLMNDGIKNEFDIILLFHHDDCHDTSSIFFYGHTHPKALSSTRHPQYTSSLQGLKATSRTQGFHSQLINYKGSRLLQGLYSQGHF